MAVVLVFGLSFATVLTLILIPVIYATLFKISDQETAAAESGNNNDPEPEAIAV
jgi:predicted RND superfamily exporter protein